MSSPAAAEAIAAAIGACPREDRSRLARELLTHAAAAIVVLEGEVAAAEALYRVADAAVSRAAGSGVGPARP